MPFASLSPPQLQSHSPVFHKPWREREISEITCLYTFQDNWLLGLGDGLCFESHWQKQVLIPKLFTRVSKNDQIENCSKEEKPDWEEIQVVKWDQPQGNLIWKDWCPYVPLFCLSLSQVREEPDTHTPLFMYSHSFTHITYSFYTELCASSPSTWVHATKWKYPYFHDSVFLSVLPFPFWGFSLSLLLFTDSLKCWRWRREELDTLTCVRYTCNVSLFPTPSV